MLKKLRLKFMLVMMTIVAMMLGIIFGMLYFSTSSNIERKHSDDENNRNDTGLNGTA